MLAHHVIFGAYGFWLPNDPRGSWSTFVGSWELYRYGPATKTSERRSVAAARHDVAARLAAKRSLKYPPVVFDGPQALSVASGFGEHAKNAAMMIHACAVLPDHVHMVIAHTRFEAKVVVNQLKGAATKRLMTDERHPLAKFATPGERPPKAFARGQWIVHLDTPADIRRAIRYVEDNPVKENLPPQRWRFVTPYAP
jgi:REP element-mobilizing transposase RayT